MPAEEDRDRARKLKKEVEELQARRYDPTMPKSERRLLKIKIETKIWLGQRLDPDQFKSYRWRFY